MKHAIVLACALVITPSMGFSAEVYDTPDAFFVAQPNILFQDSNRLNLTQYVDQRGHRSLAGAVDAQRSLEITPNGLTLNGKTWRFKAAAYGIQAELQTLRMDGVQAFVSSNKRFACVEGLSSNMGVRANALSYTLSYLLDLKTKTLLNTSGAYATCKAIRWNSPRVSFPRTTVLNPQDPLERFKIQYLQLNDGELEATGETYVATRGEHAGSSQYRIERR